jgi:RNA polymerase sigma factor (sigma-70 family)
MSTEKDNDDAFRQALTRGDESAWFTFHQRYTKRLIRYACAVVKDEERAKDAVQAVMVGLVRNRKQLEQIQDFEAYLFSALRRDLWRVLKREHKDAAMLVSLDSHKDDGPAVWQIATEENSETSTDDRDFLVVALSRLTAEMRMVIELRFFGELTFERIAQVLQLPLGTVVSRFRAGLEQLRANVRERT